MKCGPSPLFNVGRMQRLGCSIKRPLFVFSFIGSDLGQQRYIDPTNYSDLMELLTTLTTEIEKPKIKLQRFVGQGNLPLMSD